jgi:uncharacterized protein
MRTILAIDGGGIKGVVPAAFLAMLENALGEPIVSYFDLIAGTSTGGIIALGLGLGVSPAEIVRFYEERGPLVFPGNRLLRGIRQIAVAKYQQGPLQRALAATFGERRLGESTTRLLIPSLNLETGEVHIYKTAHHPKLEYDYKAPAVEVALATAAAPTFFPTYRSAEGIPLIDGGMWANNPVGVAVVEAIGMLGWPREDIRVLSIGCTTQPLGVGSARWWPSGLSYWGLKVADVFMTAQSHAALGTAYTLLGGHEHVVRISPHVGRGRFSMDNVREIPSLRGLGASEARKALPQLRPLFFATRVDPFVPCRRLSGPIQEDGSTPPPGDTEAHA